MHSAKSAAVSHLVYRDELLKCFDMKKTTLNRTLPIFTQMPVHLAIVCSCYHCCSCCLVNRFFVRIVKYKLEIVHNKMPKFFCVNETTLFQLQYVYHLLCYWIYISICLPFHSNAAYIHKDIYQQVFLVQSVQTHPRKAPCSCGICFVQLSLMPVKPNLRAIQNWRKYEDRFTLNGHTLP